MNPVQEIQDFIEPKLHTLPHVKWYEIAYNHGLMKYSLLIDPQKISFENVMSVYKVLVIPVLEQFGDDFFFDIKVMPFVMANTLKTDQLVH